MSTNIDRAADVIQKKLGVMSPSAEDTARALADTRLLRPDPSSRYDGQFRTSFSRDEDAEEGPGIEACLGTHCLAPDYKIVHRAELSIDIGGQHGYHILNAYATAEWCREAAAILLDVADEVDRKNKETHNPAADHAEEVDTDGQDD